MNSIIIHAYSTIILSEDLSQFLNPWWPATRRCFNEKGRTDSRRWSYYGCEKVVIDITEYQLVGECSYHVLLP